MEAESATRRGTTLGKELPKKLIRAEEVRGVLASMEADGAWDHLQAKDLDPRITEYVAKELVAGKTPSEIAKILSIKGGISSKQWKKIAAYFRQGFRGDAEAYLYQQTHKFYKVIDKAREVLEDAFENGTPLTITPKEGEAYTIRVKGATKELGSFLESYSRSIALPVKLWKDFGAIGEKKDLVPQGVTILVQNNIPMPSSDQIKAHQEEMIARQKAIELKSSQYLTTEENKP